MPSNVCVPHFKHGVDVTGTVTGAPVVGKTFVEFADGGRPGAPTIKTAAAGSYPAGVVAHDQVVGGYVHFLAGGIVPVVAGEDLTFNTRVQIGADGKVVPLTTGIQVGVTTVNAIAGADVAVRLSL